MAGIGFDAEIMRETSVESKRKFGKFAYFITGLKRLTKPRGKYRITIDNNHKRVYRAKNIMIANMSKIMRDIRAVPGAHPQSGELKIGIVKARSISSWLIIVMSAMRGNINKSPHYTLLTGTEIIIHPLRGPAPYVCDGNDSPQLNISQ